MLTAEEIAQALRPGYELRGLELKGPGVRTDNHLFAKVTRAALSMANLRDGGHVIVGIADDDPAALLPGLTEAQCDTWLAIDDVARKISEYADPSIAFDIEARSLPSGALVAVMQVHEFSDVPVVCKKDYQDVLRRGACYVRPRRLPETVEVASFVEMRDLIQLATEKALRAYVETSERASLRLTSRAAEENLDQASTARFDEQRRSAW